MPNRKREAQRSNEPSVRKRMDANYQFNPAAGVTPKGAVTATAKIPKGPDGGASKMPRDVAGTMPSNVMFPRLRELASNLTPNPAEKQEHAWHPGTVGRFTQNFGDRKTPHLISNPWKPTGFTGDDGAGSTAV